MYTKEKIYALIKSNDLSISYPDFVDDFTVNELPVVYGSGNFAGKLFEENYHGDRLSVMLVLS
nr:hypothetical protein [uncultured Pseudodesulfovibrio sp.]